MTRKKVERAPSPKPATKGELVALQFTAEQCEQMEKAAKAMNQSVSEWIRDAIEMKIFRTPGTKRDGASRIH